MPPAPLFCLFSASHCLIQDPKTWTTIGSTELSQGLFKLHSHLPMDVSVSSVSTLVSPFDLWHFRLGHLSSPVLNVLKQQCPIISCNFSVACDVFHFAKQRKTPFPISVSKSDSCLHMLHADIWGPYKLSSIHGYRYFLTVVDDFSRYTWVSLLKAKSEARNALQSLLVFLENQFAHKVKIVRTDNGVEFQMSSFYSSKGILHQTSCVETPEQNSVVERKHQHILHVARALMFQSHLPLSYWCYAVTHAVYIINRLPTPILNNQSPFFLLHNTLPDYTQFKVFGSLCFACTSSAHRTKFDSRAHKCVFLGFKNGTKGYVLLDIHTHRIFISSHVIFYESIFPLIL